MKTTWSRTVVVAVAGEGHSEQVVPADVLLLAGTAIVEEAVLTGGPWISLLEFDAHPDMLLRCWDAFQDASTRSRACSWHRRVHAAVEEPAGHACG